MARLLRWAAWFTVIGYYVYFVMTRPSHLNAFGHLLPSTEFWLFFLPLAATFAGLIELMMRDRAGVPQPQVGRNWR